MNITFWWLEIFFNKKYAFIYDIYVINYFFIKIPPYNEIWSKLKTRLWKERMWIKSSMHHMSYASLFI
jgi:hypothetical protein